MKVQISSNDPNRIALLNAMVSIRKHCIKCKGGQIQEVWRCSRATCDLYPLRPTGYGYKLPEEKR